MIVDFGSFSSTKTGNFLSGESQHEEKAESAISDYSSERVGSEQIHLKIFGTSAEKERDDLQLDLFVKETRTNTTISLHHFFAQKNIKVGKPFTAPLEGTGTWEKAVATFL